MVQISNFLATLLYKIIVKPIHPPIHSEFKNMNTIKIKNVMYNNFLLRELFLSTNKI